MMEGCILRASPVSFAQKISLPNYFAIPLLSSFALSCCLTNFGEAENSQHVDARTEAFVNEKILENAIIPDIVMEPKYTGHAAEFIFNTGALADFGNKIPPEQVFEAPKVIKFRCEPNELFTILLTDFDAPSRDAPYNREWLYWAVGNWRADNHVDGVHLIAPMLPINPQRGTGFHRFVFYVYKQPNNTRMKFKESFSKSETGRNNFDVKDFANDYKLGDIYAINFFLSQWPQEENAKSFTEPAS